MQIIKDGKVVEDDLRHLADDEAPSGRRFTVSLKRWLKEKDQLKAAEELAGLRVDGNGSLAEIAADLPQFEIIVVEFSALADGRGFSLARLLRERHGYGGEIRARGDFIRDQVYFLARVGVNAFEPKEGVSPESLLPALTEFTVSYQAAADDARPLYRRRS